MIAKATNVQRTYLEALCASAQLGSRALPFPYAAADRATRARIVRGAAEADIVIGVMPDGRSTVLKGVPLVRRVLAGEWVKPFSFLYMTVPNVQSARALLRSLDGSPATAADALH